MEKNCKNCLHYEGSNICGECFEPYATNPTYPHWTPKTEVEEKEALKAEIEELKAKVSRIEAVRFKLANENMSLRVSLENAKDASNEKIKAQLDRIESYAKQGNLFS